MKVPISNSALQIIIVLLIATRHQSEAKKMTSNQAKKKKHVLFMGASQTSHILHMQGLAEEMANRGYKVTFAALESDKKFISKANGIEFLSAGESEHDAAYYGYTHDILDLFRLCSDYSIHLYESLLPQLLNNNDNAVDLIVFDHLFWPAGYALSRDINANSVMLYPGLLGLEHLGNEPSYMPMIISGFTSPVTTIGNRVQNFIMLRVARCILQTIRYVIFSKSLNKLNISGSNPYGKTKLALHGSYVGLGEVSRIQSELFNPMTKSTGAWLPRTASLSKEVDSFLHKDDSQMVVFISIGTNAAWSNDIVTIILQTIQDIHNTKELRILWSLKDKDYKQLVSPAALEMRIKLDEMTDTLMIVPFVDQYAVLLSESVVVFVSHCGFGSMQEAIHTGTPVLAMPMMLESDQVTNAARLVQLGIAESFDARPGHDEISVDNLLMKLRSLTAIDSGSGDLNVYKEKANKFGKISNLLNGPSRGADWLEMEMNEGTEFMVGIETQTSWIERNSVYVYGILILIVCVLYVVVKKIRSVCKKTKKKKKKKKKD